MTLRPRRPGSARSAFTLTEILVVMGIITLLMSLLMAAVSKARESGKRTQAHTEMREFGAAIGIFKQKYPGDYIPSRIVLRERMDYNLNDTTMLEQDSLRFLLQCWPNIRATQIAGQSPYPAGTVPGTNGIDWNGNGVIDATAVTLEGDQCLVFFLGGIYSGGQMTGFSTNPSNPAYAGGNRVGPFAQFQTDRLTVRNGYPSYLDPWKKKPYVYFSNYGKQNGYSKYGSSDFTVNNTISLAPYQSATGKYLNENGFQIICAGADKEFGPGGTTLPATGTGDDDMANFSQATLGAGVK